MKILTILLLSVVALGSLTACQATARNEDGYVSVGTNDGPYDYPRHCPPGHAKKGWC